MTSKPPAAVQDRKVQAGPEWTFREDSSSYPRPMRVPSRSDSGTSVPIAFELLTSPVHRQTLLDQNELSAIAPAFMHARVRFSEHAPGEARLRVGVKKMKVDVGNRESQFGKGVRIVELR